MLADSVVTVSDAGWIMMLPGTLLMLSLFVTSTPATFLITRVSQSAVTVPTSVAVALEVAVASVYPSGSVLTLTVAPRAEPSYV